MKIIFNKLIPFNGFAAINLFGILFVRTDVKIDSYILNHEKIHTAQMKELGYIFFYLIYVAEWIFRLFKFGNAYCNISFEKEAYAHQDELGYLKVRKHYAMWKKE
jgi:hypothetical protein